MPVTAPDKVTLTNTRHCARCGGDHPLLVAAPLAQPFAPPEAAGVTWSHWVACPTNGEPILVRTDVELVDAVRARLRTYVFGGKDVHPNDVPLSPEELDDFAKFDEASGEHEWQREKALQAKAIRAVREIKLLRAALLGKAEAPNPHRISAIVNGERLSLAGLVDEHGRITLTLEMVDGKVNAIISSAEEQS